MYLPAFGGRLRRKGSAEGFGGRFGGRLGGRGACALDGCFCCGLAEGFGGRVWRKDSAEGFGGRFGGRDLYDDDGLVRGFWPPLRLGFT